MANFSFRTTCSIVCGFQYTAIVQHWTITDPTEPDQFQQAKKLMNGFFNPSAGPSLQSLLTPLLAEQCFIQTFKAIRVSPTSGNTAAVVFPSNEFPGEFPGQIDAAQVAGCAIWLTGTEAGLNGRNFIPGVSEEALENGRFVEDYRDAFQAYIDAVLDGIVTTIGTFEPVLKNDTPAQYTPIEHGYLSLTPGTQRRRLMPY